MRDFGILGLLRIDRCSKHSVGPDIISPRVDHPNGDKHHSILPIDWYLSSFGGDVQFVTVG